MSKPVPESFKEILVDGDMIAFSIAAAVEYGKDPADVNLQDIVDSIDAKLNNLRKRLGAMKVRVFLSSSENFRYKIDENYKANRADAWRPFNLGNAKAHLKGHWDAEEVYGLEADDLMAMNQRGEDTCICTLDKDLKQVPGWHYEWETKHHGERFVEVTKNGELTLETKHTTKSPKKEVKGNGTMFLLHQILVGDSTDGVLGCGIRKHVRVKTGKNAGEMKLKREGVGPLESYNSIAHLSVPDAFKVVVRLYKDVFGSDWEAKLLQQARLVHMVREPLEHGKIAQLWYFNSPQRDAAKFDLSAGVFLHG